jgi:thioredoxin 2
MSKTNETRVIRCANCGAANRVADSTAQRLQPVCGRCKKPLVSSGPVRVTDATFAEDVEQSPLPVLLDLWAPWCGPCRMVAPILEDLAVEFSGKVRVGKLNVDENPGIAVRFGVRSIPTLLILKAGREVGRLVGVQPKTEILNRLNALL